MASSTEHLTRRFSAIRKICSHFHPKIRLCTKGNFYILEYPVTKRYSGLSPHLAVLLRSQARGQQMDRRSEITKSTSHWTDILWIQGNQQHTIQHHRHHSGRGRTEMENNYVENRKRPICVV
jgi:hypothetical protein